MVNVRSCSILLVSLIGVAFGSCGSELPSKITFCGKTYDTSRPAIHAECKEPNPDLEPLERLPGIGYIRLENLDGASLAPLRNIRSKFTGLQISGAFTGETEGFAGLSHLLHLMIESPTFSNTAALAGLRSLLRLTLRAPQVSDLGPLSSFHNLEQLSIHGGAKAVTDLRPLSGLHQLEHIVLNDTGVTDLGPLAGLQNLQSLDLYGSPVTDLSPLRSCKSLQRVAGVFGPDMKRQLGELSKALPNFPAPAP